MLEGDDALRRARLAVAQLDDCRAGADCIAREDGLRKSGLVHAEICDRRAERRSEEHTSELQSLMRISYAVFCLKKKKTQQTNELQQRASVDSRSCENDTDINYRYTYTLL